MKILFVVNNFPPRLGGVENHVAELSRELVQAGHEVAVVTLAATPSAEIWHGVRIVRLREYARVANILGFPGWGTRKLLSKMIREQEFDVVSIHTRFFPMSWVGLRASQRAGVPVVHTEHGSGHVVSSSPVIRIASRVVDFTMGRFVLRHADRVLGVSESVSSFVARLSGRSSTVFYNAIPDIPVSTPKAARPAHLVFVGRIVPGKGWDVFVNLVGALHDQNRDVSAEILGDGPDLPVLLKRVADLGLTEVVSVRGRVSSLEVRNALSGATLVNPTVLAEGFQTTLLEALAANGRVATYPVPGAAALQAEGHPIVITRQRDSQQLLTAVEQLINENSSERTHPPLDNWFWPKRAEDFAGVCSEVLSANRLQ